MGQRFIDIIDFKHGTTGYDTIRSVAANSKSKRIFDSADGDKYIRWQAEGVSDADVTIEMSDPFQAQALSRAAIADITFKGHDGAGVFKLVTIRGFKAFGRSGKDSHDDKGSSTITGNGMSPDGVTPIVEEVPA